MWRAPPSTRRQCAQRRQGDLPLHPSTAGQPAWVAQRRAHGARAGRHLFCHHRRPRRPPALHPWRVAQTLDTHLGKIVRITRTASRRPAIPSPASPAPCPRSGPSAGAARKVLPSIRHGQLWETEHGPRGGDELNIIKKGANYGWPIISHGIDYPGPPIGDGYGEGRASRSRSITGPGLRSVGPGLLYAAICSRNGRAASWSAMLRGNRWSG